MGYVGLVLSLVACAVIGLYGRRVWHRFLADKREVRNINRRRQVIELEHELDVVPLGLFDDHCEKCEMADGVNRLWKQARESAKRKGTCPHKNVVWIRPDVDRFGDDFMRCNECFLVVYTRRENAE